MLTVMSTVALPSVTYAWHEGIGGENRQPQERDRLMSTVACMSIIAAEGQHHLGPVSLRDLVRTDP